MPAFFELPVPKSWRCIDFISDLHLSETMPRTFDAWAAHLRSTPADAVFILGDLFELWVGDDMRSRSFERACANELADASSRRVVAFMVGNRDFLVGPTLLRETGMVGLPDPTVLVAWDQRVLLSHGDMLCLADTDYQRFRAQVRGADWQADFLARPLADRLKIAADIRRASSQRRRFDGDSNTDVDTSTAVHWMHSMGTPEMVHGHTHKPGSDALAPGFKRHVLSDWDLDSSPSTGTATSTSTSPRAEVLRLSRDGFERLAPGGKRSQAA
jgi:UDP-2,3-diacylglucosamine hydrolase